VSQHSVHHCGYLKSTPKKSLPTQAIATRKLPLQFVYFTKSYEPPRYLHMMTWVGTTEQFKVQFAPWWDLE
jgi:hypothetical protein